MSETYCSIKKSTLDGIGDAIRGKTGGTALIPVPQLAAAVSEIQTADSIVHADIPSYVKKEALELAEKVRAVQTEDTITCLLVADSHHCAQQADNWAAQTNLSNLHCMQGIKAVSYLIDLDFCAFLGDYVFGNSSSTEAELKGQLEEMQGWLGEVWKGVPQFYTTGNHDTGEYSTPLGREYLYNSIWAHCEGATFGDTSVGYCYRDFSGKKLRVINLNTCERETDSTVSGSGTMSEEQLLWFAQTLYGVGGSSDWSVIVLGHYPLDLGSNYRSGNIVAAYLAGESVTYNGTTVDFGGHNSAKFIADFHGHTHCLKTDCLHRITNGTPTEIDAKRMATPAGSFYRNNEYTTAVYGIVFAEDVSYTKTANSGEDTAFLVNVIDKSQQLIYSFCYGAGYDRVVSYSSAVYYSVTGELTNAKLSNDAAAAKENSAYEAAISADDGYTLSVVTVTMGGADITDTAYTASTGVIGIAAVTGDVVITAKAAKTVSYTNLVPISIDISGAVYNTTGYKDDCRLSSSGEEAAKSGFAATGFIPFAAGDTIRLDGVEFDQYGCMLYFYDSSFAALSGVDYAKVANDSYDFGTWDTSEGTAFTFMPKSSRYGTAAYFRISGRGNGENMIVTVNEQIE